MSKNGHSLAQPIQALEAAIETVSLPELASIVGELGRLGFKAQTRLIHKPDAGEDGLLTVPEVAQRLKFGNYRTYELCRKGILKSFKLSNRRRIRPADLEAYIAAAGG